MSARLAQEPAQRDRHGRDAAGGQVRDRCQRGRRDRPGRRRRSSPRGSGGRRASRGRGPRSRNAWRSRSIVVGDVVDRDGQRQPAVAELGRPGAPWRRWPGRRTRSAAGPAPDAARTRDPSNETVSDANETGGSCSQIARHARDRVLHARGATDEREPGIGELLALPAGADPEVDPARATARRAWRRSSRRGARAGPDRSAPRSRAGSRRRRRRERRRAPSSGSGQGSSGGYGNFGANG